MAIKTITISLEAYEKLLAKKTAKESFTDVILKLTKKKDTLAYIRSLKPSTELANNIENVMKKTRGLTLETCIEPSGFAQSRLKINMRVQVTSRARQTHCLCHACIKTVLIQYPARHFCKFKQPLFRGALGFKLP